MVDFLPKVVSFQSLVVLCLWLYQDLAGIRASEKEKDSEDEYVPEGPRESASSCKTDSDPEDTDDKVYFDKYGHCHTQDKPFDLMEDSYKALAKGGGYNHENKVCSLSFKASPGNGVCMTFKDFLIEDCSVELLIFESKYADGDVWKALTCNSKRPSQMCTSERYVTLQVLKERLNNNRGYDFEIKIEQSSSVTEEGVVFASIGFVVGIICGVVLILIFIALAVYCCCRKKSGASTTKHSMSADQVQPSAPPLMEGEDNSAPAMHLYPHLQLQQETPMLDPPPPYEHPPSYSPQHS